MKLRNYEQSDYATIESWCFLRKVDPMLEADLPDTGLYVEDHAVGFIIMMSNNYVMLDFFITNPMSSKEDRTTALDLIMNEVIKRCKFFKIRKIIATSNLKATKDVCERHGLKSVGEFVSYQREL
jgi:hypothetical protein